MTNDRNRFSHLVIRHSNIHSSFVIRHSNFRRGFTLLELILALGLSVIIATVLTTAVYTAYHAKRSIYNTLDVVRAGEPSEILAQELTNALPPTPPPASAVSNVAGLAPSAIQPDYNLIIGSFYGDSQSLSFSTSGSEPKRGGADIRTDVRFVEYLLVAQDDGTQSLVRRVTTNVLEPTTTDQTPPDEPVCTKVLNFTLSYFDGTSWYDTWDSTTQNNALPLAVQYTLELPPRPGSNAQSRIIQRTVPLACGQPTDPTATAATGGTP
jgi:prepilin-type N-terminal cleavage/methylation domain-containing protein